MHKKTFSLLLALVLISTLLTGCFRSASKPPVAYTPTVSAAAQKAADASVATAQANVMKDIISATQTAAALAAPEVATAEPKAAEPTAKPKPKTEEKKDTDYKAEKNPDRPATYTLQKGEYPFCIARRYNLNVASLLSANGMSMDSKPATGTKLNIPQSGEWGDNRSLHAHPTSYTVKSGDTFYSIACYFGDLLPEDVAGANGLKMSDKLSAGQSLQIP